MNDSAKNTSVPFNPPLRIFSSMGTESPTTTGNEKGFRRPKLQRNVNHERVAQYFSKRGIASN